MPTFVEFWSEAHHGNPFGLMGPMYGPSGHRGDDTNGWASGTPIPSFVAGTVVQSGWLTSRGFQSTATGYSGLGWVVVVHSPALGIYFGFSHLASRGLPKGSSVSVGTHLGPIGNTGELSTGVHVHVTASRTGDNPAISTVIDPRPYIVAARNAAAGGGLTPIGDDDMPKLIRHPGGAITTVGETTYQHHNWATYIADLAVYGPYKQLTDSEYNQAVVNTQVRRAYLISGISGSGDSSVNVEEIATATEQKLVDDFTRLSDQIAELNTLIESQSGANADELAAIYAAAVKTVLAPDFAAIPENVVTEFKKPGN